MNDMEQLENQINAELAVIGRFAQPTVSAALAGTIARAMAREHRHGRHLLWMRRLMVPAAVAAGVILAVMLFVPTTKTVKTRTTDITSIWSLGMEEGTEKVFADLDFTATTTQPATEDSTDELEKYLLEAMAGSS